MEFGSYVPSRLRSPPPDSDGRPAEDAPRCTDEQAMVLLYDSLTSSLISLTTYRRHYAMAKRIVQRAAESGSPVDPRIVSLVRRDLVELRISLDAQQARLAILAHGHPSECRVVESLFAIDERRYGHMAALLT